MPWLTLPISRRVVEQNNTYVRAGGRACVHTRVYDMRHLTKTTDEKKTINNYFRNYCSRGMGTRTDICLLFIVTLVAVYMTRRYATISLRIPALRQ